VPFSETLCEAARERIARKPDPLVVDIGTGCGAVALALGSMRADAQVHGVDVSARALRWARLNARRLGIRNVRFHRGSLLDPLPRGVHGRIDVLVANVPYAPPAYRRASWDDTPGSIEGEDEDGLGLQRKLLVAAQALLSGDGCLIAQIAVEQLGPYRSALRASGYTDDRVVASRVGDAVVVAHRRT
jgi:release factor glutamine methyltransferase